MNSLYVRLLIMGVLLMAFAACGNFLTPKEQRREKALLEATETYRKLIRWGNFEEASHYLKAKEGEIPGPDLTRLKRYKVTGYYTAEQQRNDAGDEARVVAHVEYYELDTGIARALRDEQYWWYDELERRWYLGSRMPELGKS
ncbi:MAG: hypothetical protein ACREXT_08590 [Gammaproteobacteria bacterium]